MKEKCLALAQQVISAYCHYNPFEFGSDEIEIIVPDMAAELETIDGCHKLISELCDLLIDA